MHALMKSEIRVIYEFNYATKMYLSEKLQNIPDVQKITTCYKE